MNTKILFHTTTASVTHRSDCEDAKADLGLHWPHTCMTYMYDKCCLWHNRGILWPWRFMYVLTFSPVALTSIETFSKI